MISIKTLKKYKAHLGTPPLLTFGGVSDSLPFGGKMEIWVIFSPHLRGVWGENLVIFSPHLRGVWGENLSHFPPTMSWGENQENFGEIFPPQCHGGKIKKTLWKIAF